MALPIFLSQSLMLKKGIGRAGILRPTDAGTQNNWSPTGLIDSSGVTAASTVLAQNASLLTLSGISAAQRDGTVLYLYAGVAGVLISGNGAGSTPVNRFADALLGLYLNPGDGLALLYDSVQQRWVGFLIEPGTDVQIFTASGTWTKPPFAAVVEVVLLGGGGGGGSGCKGAAGTLRRGGGGGGGGALSAFTFLAATLTTTVSVTVAAAAAGGAGGNSAAGNAGTAGGDTSFGTYLIALGGPAGTPGTVSALGSSNPAPAGLTSFGSADTLSSTTGGAGVPGSTSVFGGASGAAGGGVTTGNTYSLGAAGGAMPTLSNSSTAGGAAGGLGTAGGAGSTPFANLPGTAGGSGGSNSANSGAGGNGGIGSGGGGSGAALSGTVASGGSGGRGVAIILSRR